MKLAGKKALPVATAASAWPRPAYSSRKVRKSQLRVAINRHWMKRSPGWDRRRTDIALTLPLRRTETSSSLNSPKILANLTSSSLMRAFLARRRQAQLTRPPSRRWSTPTSSVLSLPSIQPLLS